MPVSSTYRGSACAEAGDGTGSAPVAGRPWTLGVSIVTFQPDLPLLEEATVHLAAAVRLARARKQLASASLTLVENSDDNASRQRVEAVISKCWDSSLGRSRVLSAGGNIGYGRGQNRALTEADVSDYHLIMNPDVLMHREALSAAVEFMTKHADVGLLAPSVEEETGRVGHLCRRYPSVLVFLLRGFAPAWIQGLFRGRLSRFEMDDLGREQPCLDVPLASGCFMFFRTEVLRRTGGFCDDFFMYFEDYDLSMRTGRIARIAYVPAVRVVHYGGGASRKGLRHILMFIRSGRTFFSRYGWKWW